MHCLTLIGEHQIILISDWSGQFLMCSEGGEYDVEKSSRDKTHQREQLNKQFGFDKLGLKSELFIDDEDLNDEAASEEKKPGQALNIS